MTADERIAELLKETEGLTPGKDSARLVEIWEQAAALVDKSAKPKKWAAFRFKYGEAMDPIHIPLALAAYREAVTYFDPVQDRSMWAAIRACIGYDLQIMGKMTPPESEEAIQCFEDAVGEMPWVASSLALYYNIRTVGDPLENWKKKVQYLNLALAQVSPATEPVQWARLKNELAKAQNSEPDGDFLKGTQARIAWHKEALATLEKDKDAAGSPAHNLWIQVSVDLSEAYAAAGDEAKREQTARAAYAACGPATAHDPRVFAVMNMARLLTDFGGAGSKEKCLEALRLTDEAEKLIDENSQPVMAATNLKFRALVYLELVKLGEIAQLEPMLQAVDRAYGLLDANLYSDLQRVICQVATDGLMERGEFGRAIPYFEKATAAGERALQQATSRAARLECIFYMHDNYAQLGYCHFQQGDVVKGVEALDRGKGRWWNAAQTFASFEEIRRLTPKGGAMLFAAFVPKAGAVGIVTENETRVCALPELGRERLHELLLGDIQNPQGDSWIGRYTFHRSNPERWREAIRSIGKQLYELVWAPVVQTLNELGIKRDAELLWFPQAGLGVLPLQCAWKETSDSKQWISDSYAIRYAPSASCLLAERATEQGGTHLFVSNPSKNAPRGNLPNAPLELAWVSQTEPSDRLRVLEGDSATKAAMTAELARAKSLHFSGHAKFEVTEPFQSRLFLAHGEALLLDEFLPLLQAAQIREVVLSGCETGQMQVHRRADEFLGFPAAFLEHGARTVIGAQWEVDDWAATAVIGRFYEEWRKPNGPSAAEALRRAQNWLRNATVGDLIETLTPLKKLAGEAGGQAATIRTSLRNSDETQKPFADPYYWAAFALFGM